MSRLLVEEAQKRKRVVRLKGGDPFVFGRGSEEALVLARFGISVEVSPGISSSIAAPGSALVPVTHRGIATQFTVVTGHGGPSSDALPQRWTHLAKAGGTLVFLMGMKNLVDIRQNLLEAGMKKETKVAFVQRATWESERVHFTSLQEMRVLAEEEKITSPAVIIVGDVVKVGEELSSLLQNIPVHSPPLLSDVVNDTLQLNS
ncbi:MAG: uroporphyrinogen-III C-methyltransferase [Deltaproteobacteria bacterium]|nr:uroporphyrinogen-III C-methyltransferase [Deltaproteobacteria bacterium]